MATTFDVLAEPTRRRILDLLLERSRPVGELVAELGLSQPGVSKHLRVLRDSGFVRVRQDAQRRWYELRPEPLAEVDAWLAPYRRLWADRLDALERHPDAPDRQTCGASTAAGSAGRERNGECPPGSSPGPPPSRSRATCRDHSGATIASSAQTI